MSGDSDADGSDRLPLDDVGYPKTLSWSDGFNGVWGHDGKLVTAEYGVAI